MSDIKVGVRFYLITISALAAGGIIGFFVTEMTLGSGSVFWNILLGACLGALSAVGLLLLAPGKNAGEGSIGRYNFWLGLTLGSTLALGTTGASETPILSFSFSATAGFAVILAVFLWMDFREKKEGG